MRVLAHLACAHCGAPVPLTTADSTRCPSCQQVVQVPEQHRAARRDTELILTNEAAARRWLDAAGQQPSKLLSAFTFLDSSAFWTLVFPVLFVPLSLCLTPLLVPFLVAKLARVRSADVWADTTQVAVNVGLPFVVLLLGLLAAGFAKKRSLARAGLQAALAARPPSGAGGPWSCRACGAPLTSSPSALSARCDYCQADNLVRLSQGRLEAVRRRRDALTEVVRRAEKDWRALRAELRASLLARAALGVVLVALPTVPILASTPTSASAADFDLTKPPDQMPSFAAHRAASATEACTPARINRVVRTSGPCLEEGCPAYLLTSPLAGETLEVQGNALPAGTALRLEPRKQRMLDSVWASAPTLTTAEPGQRISIPVKEGGWYRLLLLVPGTRPGQALEFCLRQAPR